MTVLTINTIGPRGFNPLLIGEAAPPSKWRPSVQRPTWFQSPSHRGGGAAAWRYSVSVISDWSRFNPLLIGEAAPPLARPTRTRRSGVWRVSIPFSSGRRRRPGIGVVVSNANSTFQSPSHRGGGAASAIPLFPWHVILTGVSIPFSSGRRRRPEFDLLTSI